MDNFRGKRRLTGAMDDVMVDKAYEEFCDYVKNTVEEFVANHHLQFEISIAWDDDDEFEHEGYYDNVDDAIAALMKYKEELQ